MTPSKEVLITTLQSILLSVKNTLDNARDDKTDRDSEGIIHEDFLDLIESRDKLNKLIKELES